MLRVKAGCPVDYRLCNQTATVYHKAEGREAYSRRVYPRAFLDFKKVQSVDKTGSSEGTSFLLVLPTEEQTVYPGDKVLLGEGPEISSREAWAGFIPSKVPGLGVVKYVDPKYWQGKMVHLEAGG